MFPLVIAGWLLFADIYINQSKYEQATGVLRTVLQYNTVSICCCRRICAFHLMHSLQSCIKAYEYMGFLREKEQKWTDAAANYEEAWKISKKRNPTIGKSIMACETWLHH